MTKHTKVSVGTRVERKRDGATGVVVKRHAIIASRKFGVVKILLDVRLDDPTLRPSTSDGRTFDLSGDLSWFRSMFRVERS